MFSEYGTEGGSFSLNFPDVVYGTVDFPRGRTIYYKGYVTNESGTILSQEASFTNIPIFTGTGDWNDAARWNVQEVPGEANAPIGSSEDNVIINGNCTLTASTTCTDLTINAGTGRKLTINPLTELNVLGTLTNTTAANLLIKASETEPNGTLIFGSGTPYGTVQMYSKATWNLSNPPGNKYKWQYFGIPVKQITAGTTFNFSRAYVRLCDESVST
jgi:hypothetical protein